MIVKHFKYIIHEREINNAKIIIIIIIIIILALFIINNYFTKRLPIAIF